MRRVLAAFTEAGWISNSALTLDQMLFTPTPEGLDVAPHLLRVLGDINDDPTGEVAACTVHLCQAIIANDNYARTDEGEMRKNGLIE